MAMDDAAAGSQAMAETTSILNYFTDLPDYRPTGKVEFPLPEALLLILLAVQVRPHTITLATSSPRSTLSLTSTPRELGRCANQNSRGADKP